MGAYLRLRPRGQGACARAPRRRGDGRGPVLGLDPALDERGEAVERRRRRAARRARRWRAAGPSRPPPRRGRAPGRSRRRARPARAARRRAGCASPPRRPSPPDLRRRRGRRTSPAGRRAAARARRPRRTPCRRPRRRRSGRRRAAAAAASAAAFFAQPASSTPVTSVVIETSSPAARERRRRAGGRTRRRARRARPTRRARAPRRRGTGPPSDADRARAQRSDGERRGQRAERRHEPLREDEQRRRGAGSARRARPARPAAPAPAPRGRRGRGRRARARRRAITRDRVGQLDARAGSARCRRVCCELGGLLVRCGSRGRPRSPRARAQTARLVPQVPAPMIAARRIGGSPPSHSHWSITHGQIRSVTAPASAGEALLDLREAQRAAGADPDLVRADPPAAADVLGADHGDGDDGRAGLEREPADAALAACRASRGGSACPRGRSARCRRARGSPWRCRSSRRRRRRGRPGTRRARSGSTRCQRLAEQLLLGDVVHRPARHRRDHERVEEAAVVGGDDHRALAPGCARGRSGSSGSRCGRTAGRAPARSSRRAGWRPALARARVQHFVIHRTLAYPVARRPLQLRGVSRAIDRTRTLRGAVCGAVAAAVWALQQPLDKLVFASRFDDVELLGKARHARRRLVPGRARAGTCRTAPLFGAVYANIAPALPLPPALRGPVVALAEHVAAVAARVARPTASTPPASELPALARQPPRVRPGDLAPPAVRRRAR